MKHRMEQRMEHRMEQRMEHRMENRMEQRWTQIFAIQEVGISSTKIFWD